MPAQKQQTRNNKSSYNAKYPYNHVYNSWCGHQTQIDNTPGEERIFVRHAAGSYQEMSSDGGVTTFNVGDSKTYNKSGSTTTTDENSDSKTSGHSRSVVAGGSHSEVAGDSGSFSGGDVATVIMGKDNKRSKSSYRGTDGDSNVNTGGNSNHKVKGTMAMNASKISMNGAAGGSSDIRLKENVKSIPDALDLICKMRGVSFTWKDTDWLGTRRRHGVIAQEIEKVLPEVVDTDLEGNKMVYYTELIGVLIEAIKELKYELDSLKQSK